MPDQTTDIIFLKKKKWKKGNDFWTLNKGLWVWNEIAYITGKKLAPAIVLL